MNECPGHGINDLRIEEDGRKKLVVKTDFYGDEKPILPHVISCAGRNLVSFRSSGAA